MDTLNCCLLHHRPGLMCVQWYAECVGVGVCMDARACRCMCTAIDVTKSLFTIEYGTRSTSAAHTHTHTPRTHTHTHTVCRWLSSVVVTPALTALAPPSVTVPPVWSTWSSWPSPPPHVHQATRGHSGPASSAWTTVRVCVVDVVLCVCVCVYACVDVAAWLIRSWMGPPTLRPNPL